MGNFSELRVYCKASEGVASFDKESGNSQSQDKASQNQRARLLAKEVDR